MCVCVCVWIQYITPVMIAHLLDRSHRWSLLVPRSVCLVVVFGEAQTPLPLELQTEAVGVCVRCILILNPLPILIKQSHLYN